MAQQPSAVFGRSRTASISAPISVDCCTTDEACGQCFHWHIHHGSHGMFAGHPVQGLHDSWSLGICPCPSAWFARATCWWCFGLPSWGHHHHALGPLSTPWRPWGCYCCASPWPCAFCCPRFRSWRHRGCRPVCHWGPDWGWRFWLADCWLQFWFEFALGDPCQRSLHLDLPQSCGDCPAPVWGGCFPHLAVESRGSQCCSTCRTVHWHALFPLFRGLLYIQGFNFWPWWNDVDACSCRVLVMLSLSSLFFLLSS